MGKLEEITNILVILWLNVQIQNVGEKSFIILFSDLSPQLYWRAYMRTRNLNQEAGLLNNQSNPGLFEYEIEDLTTHERSISRKNSSGYGLSKISTKYLWGTELENEMLSDRPHRFS
jgi:hypothetical protein